MDLRTEINAEINRVSLLRDYLASTAYTNLHRRAEASLNELLELKEALKESDNVQDVENPT